MIQSERRALEQRISNSRIFHGQVTEAASLRFGSLGLGHSLCCILQRRFYLLNLSYYRVFDLLVPAAC